MARVTLMQTNFTAGEVSPRLLGRVDIARYANGAKTMENAYPLVHGGALRRDGSRFVAEAKHADKLVRLIPFIFNREQAYMLEFGDQYLRVYKDGAPVETTPGTPYEVATPYTEAMLWDIDYVQGADTMFLAHPDVAIYRLRRLDHDDWSLAAAPFNPAPFAEIGFRPQTTLSLSSAAVGSGRTLTAGAATFLNSDVGRDVWSGFGVATITGYTSSTVVTATISTAFAATSIASNEWILQGSPQGYITPSAKDPVGAEITLKASPQIEYSQTIAGISHDGVTTVTVSLTSHGYSTSDSIQISGCTPSGYDGTYTITVTNANLFTYTLGTNPGVASMLGTASKVAGAALDVWRSGDVGKFVGINRGLVEITAYNSATKVTGIILAELDAETFSPPNAWTLESAVWNADDGYPRTVTLFEQRLIAAGSPGYPQTVWMSRIGDTLDFQLGVNDDDGMSFTISSDQINPIAHIAQVKALLALTYGGEFTLFGGVEKPIAPTNIQVKNQSVYGCNSVRPVRIGNELYFVQRADRKVRAMAYKFDQDAYGSPDMSVLSEHVTESGVVDMAYQQEPESVLWMVRADGVMATLSVDRDQDVVGWARQITDGAFEAVATIPVAGGEEAWAVVRRTINGATVRYIEQFESGLATDAAITGTHPTGAAIWTGLDHLEGEEVDILADGVVMPRQTVTAGQITLSRNALAVEIGMPYTTTIVTLTPEVASGTGSAQGNSMRIAEVTLRFHQTTGAELNGQVIPFRTFGQDVLDAAPPLFTGNHRIETLGWDRGQAELTIQQRQPLPFHLLSVIKKFTSND